MDVQLHWRGRERYTVFDAAYGDGSGVRALVQAWRDDPDRPARLHVVARADGLMAGFHRIPQPEPGVTLDLLSAPLDAALAQLVARLDFVRLHGIQGAGTAFARPLARIVAAHAQLQASGLSAAQVAALAAEGFVFGDAGAATAHFASRKPRLAVPPTPQRCAIVIGAGIAGSAVCERLCARGWQVTLIERHERPAMEASGNHAGIFMPLVSKDDNIPTRLVRSAFLYALRYWEGLGGIGRALEGAACGVLQLARDAAHAQVQRSIAADGRYPPDFARWLERPQAEAVLGLPAPDGGWLFPQGGWARPGSVCDAMLAACGDRLDAHFGAGSVRLERDGDEWKVIGASGQVLAQAATVILACGAGAAQFPQAARLPLAALRGQVSHIDAASMPALPLVLCREAYVTPPSHGICCAGATYDVDPDPQLWQASHDENVGKLRSLLSDPSAVPNAPLKGRVGFRTVAPDRLPLVGRMPDFDAAGGTERLRDVPRYPGLYGLLGYASRGITWAPLAAELLAASLEGEPLPLEAPLADALDPARFVLRARRAPRGPQALSD